MELKNEKDDPAYIAKFLRKAMVNISTGTAFTLQDAKDATKIMDVINRGELIEWKLTDCLLFLWVLKGGDHENNLQV